MALRGSVILIGFLFLAAQWLWLPPDGWVTGDQGAKFLQTRAFARQGPLNPGIEVLAKDVDPHGRSQEPKLENLRGRLVSEFLWLLPLTSAPFYAVFGMRGLYVVPALSVIVIFLAAAALGRRLGDPTGLLAGWVAAVVTPAAVFGLELWEHAPAAACVLLAAALVAPGQRTETASRRLFFAGAAIAFGALFREEVIAAIPALVVARVVATPAFGVRGLVTDALWMSLGAGAVFLASVPMNLLIYGAVLPMHMTHDAWEVVKTTPYLATRWEIVGNLVPPARYVLHYFAAGVVGLLAALVEAWRMRGQQAVAPSAGSRAGLLLAHGAAIVMVLSAVGSPLWRLLHGLRVEDSYNVASIAHTWPFIVALLYLPWVIADVQRPMMRYLLTSASLVIAITLIVVPTDGGAQWSPRFFLAAAPLLAVLATAAMRQTSPLWSRAIAVMIAAILAASAVMQMDGLRWVHRAKWDSARLVEGISMHTDPGDVIMSNVYWVPELTASLAPTRRMLFFPVATDFPAASAMVLFHGIHRVTTVTSYTLTGYQPPNTIEMSGQPCRFERDKMVSLQFGLLLSSYTCVAR